MLSRMRMRPISLAELCNVQVIDAAQIPTTEVGIGSTA